MHDPHIEILKNFGIGDMPDLDIAVLGALELFQKVPLPEIDIGNAAHPLVVGSGNAEAAGRIMFKDADAVFASESSCEEKLRTIGSIDRVVIISASGGKHAPSLVDMAKRYGKPVTLCTTNPDSLAKKKLTSAAGDRELVFPKNREPYTYNTSTYMGMILSVTKEDPAAISAFLRDNIAAMDFSRVTKYDKFFLIVPDQFPDIAKMLHIKFMELFGRLIASEVATFEFMSHATTVVPSRELFIGFGRENTIWGEPEHRMHIPLPQGAGYGAMMAAGYYLVGQIQQRHEPFFKQNIAAYAEQSSKIFGHDIKPIVE